MGSSSVSKVSRLGRRAFRRMKRLLGPASEESSLGPASEDFSLGVHTIFIETTSHCNLRCTYCHRTSNEYSSKNKKMSFVLYKSIIDQIDLSSPVFQQSKRLKQHNRPSLYLHGYGEPTLHPELTSQIAYAANSEKFHEIRFVSNLLGVPKENYEGYFAAGLTHLYVSLDTLNPLVIESTRVGTDCRRLDETFTYLSGLYPDKIRVITVLSERNLGEIPTLHEYLGQRGVRQWIIQLKLDHDVHEFAVSDRDVASVKTRLDSCRQYERMQVFLEGFPYPSCTQPFDTMVINVLGHVAACCTYFSNDYIDFGQVTKRPLLEIFQSKEFWEFRELFKREPPALCKSCPMYGRAHPSTSRADEANGQRRDLSVEIARS